MKITRLLCHHLEDHRPRAIMVEIDGSFSWTGVHRRHVRHQRLLRMARVLQGGLGGRYSVGLPGLAVSQSCSGQLFRQYETMRLGWFMHVRIY